VFSPLLLSTDAYSYWAYGRVAAVHDENPYVATPDRHPADPAVTRMGPTGATTGSSTALYSLL
jgi:hypothetical protein